MFLRIFFHPQDQKLWGGEGGGIGVDKLEK